MRTESTTINMSLLGGMFDILVRSASNNADKKILLRAEIEDLLAVKSPGLGNDIFRNYVLRGVYFDEDTTYVEAIALEDDIQFEHIVLTKKERFNIQKQTIRLPGSICRYASSNDAPDRSLSHAQYELGGALLRQSTLYCPLVLGGLEHYGAISYEGLTVDKIRIHIEPEYESDAISLVLQCDLYFDTRFVDAEIKVSRSAPPEIY